MRQIIFFLLLVGLINCSTNSQEKEPTVKVNKLGIELREASNKKAIYYSEIVLSENRLDTFLLPFAERSMLIDLRNNYKPYLVKSNIGQQDGPDFTYIDIARDDENPVAYLNFDFENELKLDEIRIVDSTAIDQYGIRVGDTYQEIIEKRKADFNNLTDYHQHTYLFTQSSNIYYQLTSDFTMTEEMLENLEEYELSEEELQKCKVEYVIWRNNK